MIETVAGQVAPYTVHSPRVSQPPRDMMPDREDLAGQDDDDVELSDSQSSHPSSRPITPSEQPFAPPVAIATAHLAGAASTHTSAPGAHPHPHLHPHAQLHPHAHSHPGQADEPLALAHKAGRVLGLEPGSLAHARACLEHARDEVRRTADGYVGPGGASVGSGSGLGASPAAAAPSSFPAAAAGAASPKTRRLSVGRVAKHRKVPSVITASAGGDDAERLERRRRAADGVLYWQREVARLEG
ncbi:hypothetical protein Q5752_001153 [Cryptotrichosporon argae]